MGNQPSDNLEKKSTMHVLTCCDSRREEMKKTVISCAAILFLLPGCGGGGGTSSGGGSSTYAGTYQGTALESGTLAGTTYSGTYTLAVVVGNDGTFNAASIGAVPGVTCDPPGASGAVNGNTLTVNQSQTCAYTTGVSCTTNFSGTGTIVNNVLSGTLNYTITCSNGVSGNGTLSFSLGKT